MLRNSRCSPPSSTTSMSIAKTVSASPDVPALGGDREFSMRRYSRRWSSPAGPSWATSGRCSTVMRARPIRIRSPLTLEVLRRSSRQMGEELQSQQAGFIYLITFQVLHAEYGLIPGRPIDKSERRFRADKRRASRSFQTGRRRGRAAQNGRAERAPRQIGGDMGGQRAGATPVHGRHQGGATPNERHTCKAESGYNRWHWEETRHRRYVRKFPAEMCFGTESSYQIP